MTYVQDNGSGIPEDELEQIFSPFYSTKQPGKGTGLGLSVSYSMIRRFGGNLTVESNQKKGSKFSVWLLNKPELISDDASIAAQLQSIERESSAAQAENGH